MSLTLMSLTEADLIELRDAATQPRAVASFERRHGLRVEPGALPPVYVVDRALANLTAAPAQAALLATHLYLLDGDLVVGSGGIKAPIGDDGEVEIGYGVAPSFQGCGIGTAGAQALIEACRAAGVKQVVASTQPDNTASCRLLQRLGFVQFGSVVDPEDGLLLCWRLSLQPSRSIAAAVAAA